eukprot:4194_1
MARLLSCFLRVFTVLVLCVIVAYFVVSLKITQYADSWSMAIESDSIPKMSWDQLTLEECFGAPINPISLRHSDGEMLSHFHTINAISKKWRNTNITSLWTREHQSIETPWFTNVEETLINSTNFKAHFGPFIPLFIPWTVTKLCYLYRRDEMQTQWDKHNLTLCGLLTELFEALDPSFLYATVSSHDQGIITVFEHCEDILAIYYEHWQDKILQFSAGGLGHVPLPLSVMFEDRKKATLTAELEEINKTNLTKTAPFDTSNKYLLGWGGSMWDIRTYLVWEFWEYIKNEIDNDKELLFTTYDWGEYWPLFDYGCCKFVLCARGRGPTTFSIYETLAFGGAIPIYVWSAVEWIPYKSMSHNFLVSIEWKPQCNDTLFDIINAAKQLNATAKYDKMLRWIHDNYARFFSYEGVERQIKYFLTDGPSNNSGSRSKLECYGKPPTADHNEFCTSNRIKNEKYAENLMMMNMPA